MFVCYHGTNFVFARSPVLSTSSGSVFCPQQHNLSDNMIAHSYSWTITTTTITKQTAIMHSNRPRPSIKIIAFFDQWYLSIKNHWKRWLQDKKHWKPIDGNGQTAKYIQWWWSSQKTLKISNGLFKTFKMFKGLLKTTQLVKSLKFSFFWKKNGPFIWWQYTIHIEYVVFERMFHLCKQWSEYWIFWDQCLWNSNPGKVFLSSELLCLQVTWAVVSWLVSSGWGDLSAPGCEGQRQRGSSISFIVSITTTTQPQQPQQQQQ